MNEPSCGIYYIIWQTSYFSLNFQLCRDNAEAILEANKLLREGKGRKPPMLYDDDAVPCNEKKRKKLTWKREPDRIVKERGGFSNDRHRGAIG